MAEVYEETKYTTRRIVLLDDGSTEEKTRFFATFRAGERTGEQHTIERRP